MEQNVTELEQQIHRQIVSDKGRCQVNSLRKGKSFQATMLEQLNIHM